MIYGMWTGNQTGTAAEIHVELLPAAVAGGISHRNLFGSPVHDIALLF